MHTDFIRSCLVGLTFVVPVAAAACSSDPALIGGDKNPVDGNGGDTGRPNDAGSGGATGMGGDVPAAGGSSSPGSGGSPNPGTGGSPNPGSGGAPPRGSGGAAAGGSGGGDVCSLPIDPGTCMAIQPRWGFDPATQDCTMFIYGGCQGNENRFATRDECMARCGERCAPQDAHEVGSCEPLRGYKWDGNACVLVSGCSCQGEDCDNLTSREQCESDHAGCPKCSGARNAVLDFLEQNKECTVAEDCGGVSGGCNLPAVDCTGTIYVNKDMPQDRFQSLRATLAECLGTSCDGPVCAKLPNPPDCVLGRCR